MLVIGKDDGVGHALHDRGHARDGDFHVPHAVVIVFDLEQPGELAVGAFHKIAELPELCVAGTSSQLADDDVYIGPHAARGTYLLLNLQLAGFRILYGQAVVATLALGFPAARKVAVNHGVRIQRPAANCAGGDQPRFQILQRGNKRVFARPQRCVEFL